MEEIFHLTIGGENYIPIHWDNSLIEVRTKQSKYSASNRYQLLKFIGDTQDGEGLLRFLKIVLEKQSELACCNAAEMKLWILIVVTKKDAQCNYTLGVEIIHLLNALKALVCIEYMTEENNDLPEIFK